MTEHAAKYDSGPAGGGNPEGRQGQDAYPYTLPLAQTSHVLTFTTMVPPSLNNAYPTSKSGHRHLSKDAAAYKKVVGWVAFVAARKAKWEAGDARLGLGLRLWFPKAVRRRDLSNRIKILEDSIAEALGFDDERIDQILVQRGGVSDDPRCEVTLWHL